MKKSICVITGGAGGMGYACAHTLGKEYDLVLSGRKSENLEKAAAELKKIGINAQTVVADVSNPEDVNHLVEVATGLGDVAALVNTAGVSTCMAGPEEIIKTNVLGTYNVTEKFAPLMKRGGAIVNIASTSGHMFPLPEKVLSLMDKPSEADLPEKLIAAAKEIASGNDFLFPMYSYAISKRFVIRYCCGVARRLYHQHGIRINSVSPGCIDTPMLDIERQTSPIDDMMLDIALMRTGAAYEIANAVEFLLSDKASYISGNDLLVDGGHVASVIVEQL